MKAKLLELIEELECGITKCRVDGCKMVSEATLKVLIDYAESTYEMVRLRGNSLVCPSGVIRYATELANSKDTATARKIISAWSDDERVIRKVFEGDYEIDGEEVVIVLEKNQ